MRMGEWNCNVCCFGVFVWIEMRLGRPKERWISTVCVLVNGAIDVLIH